jgi:hypothetical protein
MSIGLLHLNEVVIGLGHRSLPEHGAEWLVDKNTILM